MFVCWEILPIDILRLACIRIAQDCAGLCRIVHQDCAGLCIRIVQQKGTHCLIKVKPLSGGPPVNSVSVTLCLYLCVCVFQFCSNVCVCVVVDRYLCLLRWSGSSTVDTGQSHEGVKRAKKGETHRHTGTRWVVHASTCRLQISEINLRELQTTSRRMK